MSPPSTTVDGFVHPALFYRDEDDYLAGTVPFIRAGLTVGEPVAVSVPRQNVALLRKALGADSDRVRFMDMTIVGRNPGRIIPWVLRAFADAHPTGRVRIIGEPIWAGRTEDEYPACAQHEALINLAFAGRGVTILCPYDATALDPQVLADAAVTHPVLVDGDGERVSDRYDPDEIIAGYNRPLPPPPGDAAAFAFTVDTLREARHVATSTARRLRLPEARIADLELAVSELAANSIAHGGGTGTIRVWTDDEHLICQVEDTGQLTDPLAGRIPVGPDSPRGRGLTLVNHVADLVRTHRTEGATTTRIHISHDG